jgi:hypothetical protein
MPKQVRVVSHRLVRFMEKQSKYWDCGDPENGPELCSEYNGPHWAIDAYNNAVFGPEYTLALQNFYAGMDDYTLYMTDREADALTEQYRKEAYNV